MINPSKHFPIGSLEKVSMPKTHRGLAIKDNFYHGQNVHFDPSGFFDSDKACRASAIDDIFSFFVNICVAPLSSP
jgi:hypothetical protein